MRDPVEPAIQDISASVGSPQFRQDQVQAASVSIPDEHLFHVGALLFEATAKPLGTVRSTERCLRHSSSPVVRHRSPSTIVGKGWGPR